jgi:D-arabinose 1-dehydrogenase-like Zn-dependent alcohol dehydrogenase
MTVLKESLKLFKYDKLILVIGMLKDKDTQKMLNIIVPEADIIITTTPISERAYKASELAQKIDKENVISIENIENAVKYALDIAKEEDMVLFCGSLYMIGYVRSMLKKVIIKIFVMEITGTALLQEIDKALKAMKEAERNLEMLENDNYLKIKLARLKYDFARQEYLRLLRIAKEQKIKYNMNELMEKIIDV